MNMREKIARALIVHMDTFSVGFKQKFPNAPATADWEDYSPAEQSAARFAALTVLAAVREYLPPDGISKDELISRVIEAVDNPEFNEGLHKPRVRVKPLEWRNGCASTPIGDYLVVEVNWYEEPFWFSMFNGKTLNKLGEHKDEASAIAAAQADYERRILSAIET